MPPAARVTDTTTHGGVIVGPGEPTILIGGMPAAVMGDNHVCALPPNVHQPTS
ncbi:MAG: PAAR domain-containing protein, partial [Bacteroidales bacterium]|nr:PAAR domain-containing protein [Bacteroidales bacterium]